MKITEIVVSAGRTVNHPRESYSNLKPQVTLKAAVADGEDATKCVQELQAKAEQLVEDHKNSMINAINQLHELSERQSEMVGLERTLRDAQGRLDQIRKENPELATLQLPQQASKNADDVGF